MSTPKKFTVRFFGGREEIIRARTVPRKGDQVELGGVLYEVVMVRHHVHSAGAESISGPTFHVEWPLVILGGVV